MKRKIGPLVLAGALLLATIPASAQAPAALPAALPPGGIELSLTGQPRAWLVEDGPYVVKSYRNTRLGMSVDEVMAQITKDYPASVASLKDEVDPVTRTRGLAIVVPALPPGPGPATISYVFGASTRRLTAINVYWLLDAAASEEQRGRLVAAATELASGFVGWEWPVLATARGHVTGPGVLIVFSGRDDAGGGVEVRLDGVALDVERPQRPGAGSITLGPEHRPAPPGPAQLRLSFVANVDMPDIYRIPAGAF